MTQSISAAEAKSNLAKYLRATERGNTVLITRHGRAVAALVPAEDLAQIERLRSVGPEAGLAGLAGGWEGSDALAGAATAVRRSAPRRVPHAR